MRPYLGSSHALHFASPSTACFVARLFIELAQAAALELCGQVPSCGAQEIVQCISPQLRAGFLFLILYPASAASSSSSSTSSSLSQAKFVTHTHNFGHAHTQLCHTFSFTPTFSTQNHSFSHTALSQTTLSHNFVARHFHTHFCHTPKTLPHTIFYKPRGRPGSWQHRRSICVAGVALPYIGPRLAWQAWRARQAWHLATSTFVLLGRHVTDGTLLACAGAGGVLGSGWSPVTPQHFAWQGSHLATSAFVSRARPVSAIVLLGKCGT